MCQQDTSSTQVPVFPNNIVLKIDWQKLCSIDWFVQFCFGHNNIVRFHIIADAGNLCGFTFNAVGIDCLDIKLAIRIWEWLVFTTTYCGTLGLTSWSTGESCWPRELKAPGLVACQWQHRWPVWQKHRDFPISCKTLKELFIGMWYPWKVKSSHLHCHSEYNATMWLNFPAADTHSETCRGRGDGTTYCSHHNKQPHHHRHCPTYTYKLTQGTRKNPPQKQAQGGDAHPRNMIRAIRKSLCSAMCAMHHCFSSHWRVSQENSAPRWRLSASTTGQKSEDGHPLGQGLEKNWRAGGPGIQRSIRKAWQLFEEKILTPKVGKFFRAVLMTLWGDNRCRPAG